MRATPSSLRDRLPSGTSLVFSFSFLDGHSRPATIRTACFAQRRFGGRGICIRQENRPIYTLLTAESYLAQRKPQKSWRRTGKSQLRKVLRIAPGRVAHEPPRRTLYSLPKKTSEYSLYGKASKPG